MTTENNGLRSWYGKLYGIIGPVVGRLYVSYKSRRAIDEGLFWVSRLWAEERAFTLPEPRIIFHGASVGEISGILPVVKELDEMGFSGSVILSTGTPTGFRRLASVPGRRIVAVPAPLDTPLAVRNFLNSLKPSLYVLFEADYWPVTLLGLSERSIPTLLCNGRISRPSFLLYRSLGGLFHEVFSHFSWMGMAREEDRSHAVLLGAEPQKVEVVGSTKYDLLKEYIGKRCDVSEKWKRILRIDNDVPVMVAGSLRGIECRGFAKLVVKLFDEFRELICILAPRHIRRVPELEKDLAAASVSVERLSAYLGLSKSGRDRVDPADRRIIIVDTLGHLFELYSVADVAFCGGTLEKIGGHNILEAVVWGCPVIFGPYTFKVSREAEILEKTGIGVRVKTFSELYCAVRKGLENFRQGRIDPDLVRAVMNSVTGASRICAEKILKILL